MSNRQVFLCGVLFTLALMAGPLVSDRPAKAQSIQNGFGSVATPQKKPKTDKPGGLSIGDPPQTKGALRVYSQQTEIATYENRWSITIGNPNGEVQRVLVIRQALDPMTIMCIEHPAPIISGTFRWGTDQIISSSGDVVPQDAKPPDPPKSTIPARTCKTIADWLAGTPPRFEVR